MIHLVLGGARSGKSSYAQALAEDSDRELIYLATAEAKDEEMAERIRHHQQQRNERWQLTETPLNISATIEENATNNNLILIDCLTLWLSNLLMMTLPPEQSLEQLIKEKTDRFIHSLELAREKNAKIILVSNETGMGIIPMNQLSRRFVDESGRLHQQLAALADKVTLMVAGLPLRAKD